MADALTPLESGTDLNQAVRFHARERRLSLAGIPELFRTHHIFGGSTMPVPAIVTGDIFPARDLLITFKTAIRITDAGPIGLVFEFGGSARGCGVGILGPRIALTAGGNGADAATALFNNGIDLPVGLEAELVASIRPGDGRIRLWVNGQEAASAQAANGDFDGDWSDAGTGSFASAAAGTPPAGLAPANVAPTNFEVIQPLSIYVGQVPRHFF